KTTLTSLTVLRIVATDSSSEVDDCCPLAAEVVLGLSFGAAGVEVVWRAALAVVWAATETGVGLVCANAATLHRATASRVRNSRKLIDFIISASLTRQDDRKLIVFWKLMFSLSLAAGGWRLAAGGWRLAAGGWRLATGDLTTLPLVPSREIPPTPAAARAQTKATLPSADDETRARPHAGNSVPTKSCPLFPSPGPARRTPYRPPRDV